jgi:hypothetical protein
MTNPVWFPYGPGMSHFGDRPCVPVQFIDRRTSQPYQPVPILIDSGADCTVLPAEWAPALGLNLDGAGEVRNRFGAQLDPGDGVLALIAGTYVMLRPRFALEENIIVPGHVIVLGRYDFFAHFEVLLDELNQRFGLKPYPPHVRGQHPFPAPACGIAEPEGPPVWLNGTPEAA